METIESFHAGRMTWSDLRFTKMLLEIVKGILESWEITWRQVMRFSWEPKWKLMRVEGNRNGKEVMDLRQCWDVINGTWKLPVLQKNFSTFLPFSPSLAPPLFSWTWLSLDMHSVWVVAACLSAHFSSLKCFGARSLGCYSPTSSLPFPIPCFLCLVLKY